MLYRLLPILLILSLVGFASVSQAQSSNAVADNITEYLSRLEGVGYSGSVMVVQDDEVLVNEGYGLANIETGEANTADTIYTIGSITKLFTAISILQLHEAGTLDINAPISDYLPDVPADKADITIIQIMNMEGGLATDHTNGTDFDPMSREEALDAILNAELYALPGTEFNYSNSGYTLLAILIEMTGGQSYQDYIREHILNPLDMRHSGFRGEAFENVAYASNIFDDYGTANDWDYSWVVVGNGGMVSNNADLYRFMQAVINYELVSQETTRNWVDFGDAGGWAATAGGGSSTDFNAAINMKPAENIYILNMTNDISFPGEHVNLFLEQIVEGLDVALAPEVIEQPEDTILNSYAGDYQLASGGIIHILSGENGLRINASGQDAVNALIPTHSSSLYERFEQHNQDSEAILEAISTDDFVPLANAFDIEISDEGHREFWSGLEAEHGTFEGFTVLGSTISQFGIQELMTVIELNFSNNTSYMQLFWNEDNQIVGLFFTEQSELINQPLFPTGDSMFTPYNVFVLNNPTITFDTGDSLSISSIHGELIAERIPADG